MGKRDVSSTSRSTVISVRLDDQTIQVLDLLVQSGLMQSRSEAASHLISVGIQSAGELIGQARQLAENVQRIRREMMEAVAAQDLSKITALLDHDQSLLKTQTESGDTPLLMSVYYGAKDVTQLLLARGAELNMFEAASTGNTQRLQEILSAAPERVNEYSHDGWTALHLAAFFGHLEAAQYLIGQGADLQAMSQNGMNNLPLHAALANRRTEIADLLIAAGSDVTVVAGAGWTPLHLAAANGCTEQVRTLIGKGVDLSVKNNDGNTPLALARAEGHQASAELLEQAGGQV